MSLNDYQLLFNKKKKEKNKRPKLDREKIERQQYDEVELIHRRIGELPSDEILRVKFIRNAPNRAYRATIYKHYKVTHRVTYKDDRVITLQPGLYVKQAFWFEVVNGELNERSSKTYQRR